MSVFLVLAHALALLASPVPPAPTEAWRDKAPAGPVEVDFDHCSVDGTIIRLSLVSPTGCFPEDDVTLVFENAGKKATVRWPGQCPRSWTVTASWRRRTTRWTRTPITRVWVDVARIHAESDFEKTYPRFARFFPNPKAFATAAGRNPDPMHLLAWEAKTARGRTCVQLYGWDAAKMWASLPWCCETK